MAHNLHIGQKFEDFAAFESANMRYQNAENVQFYRRDSRSVIAFGKEVKSKN